MAAGELVLRYDGLSAETDHMIDMRRLGNALVGLDKIITTGVIVLSERREPRRGERLPFRVVAGEPKANCVSVLAGIATGAQQSFPFAMSVIQTGASDLIWNWVSYVFKMLGGRMSEADPHFERLMELTKAMHEGDLQEREKMREFFLQVLDRIKPSAALITKPVGESSNSVSFVEPQTGKTTTLDVPMAEAVRSKEVLEVGDMQRFGSTGSLSTRAELRSSERISPIDTWRLRCAIRRSIRRRTFTRRRWPMIRNLPFTRRLPIAEKSYIGFISWGRSRHDNAS
jgi:hypothetical protein